MTQQPPPPPDAWGQDPLSKNPYGDTSGQGYDQGAAQPYGQPHGQPYGGSPVPGGAPTAEERTWAAAAHWTALVAAFVALAFLGPLLVFLVRGTTSPYVRRHAVNALNFHLSLLIYGIVGGLIAVILVIVTFGLGVIVLIPVIAVLAILWIVAVVVGAIKASNGEEFRYPLTITLVR